LNRHQISIDRILGPVFSVVTFAKKRDIKCTPVLIFVLINKETHFPMIF